MNSTELEKVSDEELQLYDRQIRLWGMDAQMRLKQAKILVIGVSGLSSEVIKNLVLAGVNTVTLCDCDTVTVEDINNNILIDHFEKNKAKASTFRTGDLNPRVTVKAFDYYPIELCIKPDTIDSDEICSIKDYDIIILSTSMKDETNWIKVNKICRDLNKYFFAMDSFGWHAFTFVDLGKHNYIKELKKSAENESNENQLTEDIKEFCSLSDAFNKDWKKDARKIKRTPLLQFLLPAVQSFVSKTKCYMKLEHEQQFFEHWTEYAAKHGLPNELVTIKDFRDCCGVGHVPVNAVLGGLVAQEMIKAISKKNEPYGNFLFFNGNTCSGDSTFITAD